VSTWQACLRLCAASRDQERQIELRH